MPKSSEVIALDIDGVLADLNSPFLKHVNTARGTNFSYADCISHDFTISLNLPEEAVHELLAEFYALKQLESLLTLTEADNAVKLLSQQYELVIITSRHDMHRQVTQRWVTKNFGTIPIYYANGRNNQFAGGDGRLFKPQKAEELGAIALIEDNDQEFVYWDSATTKPICLAQPWNACVAVSHPHILRSDWPGILEYFLG